VRGYKEIHLRALKLLAPGGVIATFCCSHHIDDAVFLNCIEAASNDAHRSLRLVETYSQSLDHPVVLQIPESRYLKGFALESVF
jgi:23S rRNA (cytosine1962-C5)-methyltransferase